MSQNNSDLAAEIEQSSSAVTGESMTDSIDAPKEDAPPAASLTVEQKYKKLKHREHILKLPDTYVGSVEPQPEQMWVFDSTQERMVRRKVKYIPGLYKIFDEILVNAIDQFTRIKKFMADQDRLRTKKKRTEAENKSLKTKYRPVRNIKVCIEPEHNRVSVENDGDGIDIVMHQEEGVYVPELIFGHLLTSENYEDDEMHINQDKTWGGKNGYGAKLANIFSTRFEVETVDEVRHLRYHQIFRDNMSVVEEPTVEKYNKIPYTKITFYPDLKRFNLPNGLDKDTVDIMKRRVYDTAGWTDIGVNVYLNEKKLDARSFERYMDLYLPAKTEVKRVFYQANERWQIGICISPDQKFEQVSFVNGVCTLRGGKHVDHVVNNLTKKMLEQTSVAKGGTKGAKEAKAKAKAAGKAKAATTNVTSIKPQHVKDNMWIFVKSTIVNPSFDTQTKEMLTSAMSKFGSRCDLPDDLVAKINKQTGIMERARELSAFKEKLDLGKTDGEKRNRLNVPKLDDAHYAGNADPLHSSRCILVITEGDSAKTFATDGIAALDDEEQKYWGSFPIRGKLLNVRDATAKQVANNQEVMNLKRILGLQHEYDYSTNKNSLRYGGFMILTDADVDGHHIKGLLMNFIHYFWPSLLKRNDFFKGFWTPIVRAWKWKGAKKNKEINKSTMKNFWSEAEYKQWKLQHEGQSDWKNWEVKYYKGLGSSTDQEAAEFFRMMRVTEYQWQHDLTPAPTPVLVGGSPTNTSASSGSGTSTASSVAESSVASTPDLTIGVEINGGMVTPAISSATMSKISITPKLKEKTKKQLVNDKLIDFSKLNPNDNAITLAFDKRRADDRKKWLAQHHPDEIYDFEPQQSIRSFIDQDLRQFSVEDCKRSIPSVCDGLKPSQRKVMYYIIKKNQVNSIKIAQLAGYVSAETAYHHGEASLFSTMIKLAQTYVGSNNINLIYPAGQFGTRRQNGEDAASPRYIFTYKTPITSALFNKADNPLYHYLDDDGFPVEPRWFLPIIPMILVNGTSGIGTGYSTKVPSYNPREIIDNLKRMIKGDPPLEMAPWYRGFLGQILPNPKVKTGKSYICRGCYRILGPDQIEILEIPITMSLEKYKDFCEDLLEKDKKKGKKGGDEPTTPSQKKSRALKDLIKSIDLTKKSTKFIRPKVTFVKDGLKKLLRSMTIEEAFKLETTITTTNMHLFNENDVIQKYDSVTDILKSYYPVRLNFYHQRKLLELDQMELDHRRISAKLKFVLDVIDDQIVINKQKRAFIIQQLQERNYPMFSDKKMTGADLNQGSGGGEGDADTGNAGEDSGMSYNYLLHMRIESFTEETIEKLEKEASDIEHRLEKLKKTTPEQLWLADLAEFDKAYKDFEQDWGRKYKELNDLQKITGQLTPGQLHLKKLKPPSSLSMKGKKLALKGTKTTKGPSKLKKPAAIVSPSVKVKVKNI